MCVYIYTCVVCVCVCGYLNGDSSDRDYDGYLNDHYNGYDGYDGYLNDHYNVYDDYDGMST